MKAADLPLWLHATLMAVWIVAELALVAPRRGESDPRLWGPRQPLWLQGLLMSLGFGIAFWLFFPEAPIAAGAGTGVAFGLTMVAMIVWNRRRGGPPDPTKPSVRQIVLMMVVLTLVAVCVLLTGR